MERQYVGIDLHRRRSVIVRRSTAGETLSMVRIDSDPVAFRFLRLAGLSRTAPTAATPNGATPPAASPTPLCAVPDPPTTRPERPALKPAIVARSSGTKTRNPATTDGDTIVSPGLVTTQKAQFPGNPVLVFTFVLGRARAHVTVS